MICRTKSDRNRLFFYGLYYTIHIWIFPPLPIIDIPASMFVAKKLALPLAALIAPLSNLFVVFRKVNFPFRSKNRKHHTEQVCAWSTWLDQYNYQALGIYPTARGIYIHIFSWVRLISFWNGLFRLFYDWHQCTKLYSQDFLEISSVKI